MLIPIFFLHILNWCYRF